MHIFMIGDFNIQVYIIPYIHGPDLHEIFDRHRRYKYIYIYTVVLQKAEESSRTEQMDKAIAKVNQNELD